MPAGVDTIKVLTAHTFEIDNITAAVADIEAQIEGADLPPSHTFGVFSCHYEFVLSGAAEAICRSFPFTVCGATSSLIGTNSADDKLIFTIMIVSGDEITGTRADKTPPLPVGSDPTAAFSEIFKEEEERAALVYVFAPDFMAVSGDELCSAYNKTGYGAPLFGTYSVDDSPMFNEQCFVYSKGGFSSEAITFLRVYGDIDPVIAVCSIPKNKILPKKGVVTSSAKNVVRAIDNAPASYFLQNFGLAKQLEASGAISALSLIANTPGSDEYYSRTLLGINDDGSAVTGGDLQTLEEIRIGLFDREGMLSAAYTLLNEALDRKTANAVFIHACATRSVALGAQEHDEITLARRTADSVPFMLSYAGGEIAPKKSGNAFFYNQSFCICVI
jgi:hypothetical protein